MLRFGLLLVAAVRAAFLARTDQGAKVPVDGRTPLATTVVRQPGPVLTEPCRWPKLDPGG
jgi:hypothetical protein